MDHGSVLKISRLFPHVPEGCLLRKEGFTDHCVSKDPASIAKNSLVAPRRHVAIWTIEVVGVPWNNHIGILPAKMVFMSCWLRGSGVLSLMGL
eukprot:s3444_g5.t1